MTFLTDPTLLAWLGALSLLMFVATLLALPPLVAFLPEDYFVRPRRKFGQISILDWIWIIAKNVLGGIIILAGISMLILPGQGLLTILVGVMLVNFPGKRRAERWLAGRPRVLATLNWLRKKTGRPPLRMEEEDD